MDKKEQQPDNEQRQDRQPEQGAEKRGRVHPDEGQGQKGNFGTDGDWGKENEDLKKKQRKNSPIPIKEK